MAFEHRFGSAPAWSVGAEEELFLVDAETLQPARDGFSRAFGEAAERIKPELLESFVEIVTGVHETAAGVEHELRELRHEVAGRAGEHGLAVVACGSHPTARGTVPIVPFPRYERMAEELGPRLKRQAVCGLHVHVSLPDAETALRAFEGVVAELPRLLAESANSPFWNGEPSGRRSIRSRILLEMPTGGTPPVLRSWDDWHAAARGDNTRRHWDAWLRPEYGTLEVRVLDQPTALRRTGEFVAEVQRVVREAAQSEHEPFDREDYERERERAGLEGGGPEAERQLELGPEAALREIAARTLE